MSDRRIVPCRSSVALGFTFIEILIVVALIIVVSGAGYMSLAGIRAKRSLELTVGQLVSALRDTQGRAMAQEGGVRWGTYLSRDANGSRYEVFRGPDRATGVLEQSYGLAGGSLFTNPSPGRSVTFAFAPITGTLAGAQVVSLTNPGFRQGVGDVAVNTSGRISSRVEYTVAGYWHFDEGAGTALSDASGSGNSGSAPPLAGHWLAGADCRAGNCYGFDGSTDYFQIDDAPSIRLQQVTVEAWFSTTNSSLSQAIVSKLGSGGYQLSLNSGSAACGSATLCFEASLGGARYAAAATPPAGVSSNAWHHVAGSYDGSTVRLYLDGVEVASAVQAGPITYDAAPLCIGSEASATDCRSGGGFFFGAIDEVRLFGRALSGAEVANHYHDL